ncbi:IS3 family transposase [Pseudonocardia oroxyli]|uniref:Transposase InsO and inactivated derivatives n=1 Tax=Pseudonocardia oroxyli TaxID=366584 RepID=A0A1G8ENU9_PSEOR|nr:IS3 family transposase [Pseudonocardia oroxyli]SDH71369.1 Transposase InsO and inactivated derivatives [Pseudonocardia oroxyli]
MIYPVVRELADDGTPVAVACRVLGVSTSGFYDWRDRPTSPRRQADLQLVEVIRDIHSRSRQTYRSPRVHAELRLGRGIRVGRKRVERLMREHGIVSVHRRSRRGCTWRDPAAAAAPDLVDRRFVAARPNALWVSDITQHRTDQRWVYCAVVLDTFSRRVIGWSIADHLRTELIVDALEMACLRRGRAGQTDTTTGTIFHSDHGSQYTSWAFGQRLRQAGLLGSMGSVGDCFDCETGVRRPVGLTHAYDWPSRCPGVDLSAARATPPLVAHRAGSDLIGA